ncbi:MAG: transcription-repair coupling factor [Deltaproteobacteria bacterium]|nr:MAG: transcription-repair coupling factor [Deltaproteobacteria bacterium]
MLRGLRKLDIEGSRDFILIEYEGGDRLYVPVDRMNLVHRWVGPSEQPPRLSRLGGPQWRRAKRRVRRAVQEVARELVELYAARKALPGHAFSPPDALFREFEATFPYEETPDQLEAIEAVIRDMCSPIPMDRLICGDVGFGKTEVAIRAAFKAVMDGKQVAVLVPTTVLAEQHYRTFRERLDRYPVVVEVLSRFRSPSEQKRILEDLRRGRIDIIIGTHRLLSKDVVFRDLGLLIIDDEQRFGVAHKERLKELKKTVDCLTLTATPIPRTLQMALVGLKEMSLITTPPAGRQSIKTRIIPFNEKLIRKAIMEELERGGQVFFIHNRIASIFQVARRLERIVPEARIAVAHGQMNPRELERIMMHFVRGKIDVLVSTSIVELGLDIPNANTIIIDEAHTFGLSDLYQLRGRVGRSWRKAYAYLIVPSPGDISRDARKRLKALEELSELGSGFRLAMRDLEIRGAGTLFGHRQSGHVADVGLELYNQMLEEAVRELKGDEIKRKITPEIRVPIEAHIPQGYIQDDSQRLLFYRRLSEVEDPRGLEALREELIDRYGPLPPEVEGLLEVISLKLELQELGIERLEVREGELRAKLTEEVRPEGLISRIMRDPRGIRLTPDMELVVRAREDWRAAFRKVRSLLRDGGGG